ncbi:FMN-dependent NADH-azoreductase [Nocardioides lianchengensis]|uniref:FMN dependent NADH:quinone oxidoreductase n=1 Tax=Nocardioides lianchengensis TaxID=1045774 RepID=A0A1G6JFG7_9ACTN|nr:NAD(P)H-dependent oxidoreductase [Nocardioides lianchengensis]NYG12760.1 FMN-dependent NADH-azoreductase [Nocardioides lianchengensis]SDC17440.1 FMN-dependent NADH-azoreductase [Nocardioides lianchengensis]
MTLLRVDASIQGDRSASSALADQVLEHFVAARPDVPVVTRHLGSEPLPSDAWATAIGGNFTPEADRTDAQRAAVALAHEVANELGSAEAAVLALPLYNWGVSQHVKTWIDLAIAGAPHGTELLAGKPVTLIVTRGGAYGPGTPKEGWDHSVDYLRRVIEEVWGADLTLIERELTLVGVNPALDAFADLAAEMRSTAEEQASKSGADLAARHSA